MVGALFIVWLRWMGTLPRFSSTVEIESCEDEYKKVSSYITKKMEVEGGKLDAPEVEHSNMLRDDIWRQRTQSFMTSALLYVVLGGASAVLFVGLEIQNILDPLSITKLLAAGALWTTFYSFLDVKKTSAVLDGKKESVDKEILAKAEEVTKGLTEKLEAEKAKVLEIAGKYNAVVEEFMKLKDSGGK
jgi:hypothetical protein